MDPAQISDSSSPRLSNSSYYSSRMKFPGLEAVVLSARRLGKHSWEWGTTAYPPQEVRALSPHRTVHGASPAGNAPSMKSQEIA